MSARSGSSPSVRPPRRRLPGCTTLTRTTGSRPAAHSRPRWPRSPARWPRSSRVLDSHGVRARSIAAAVRPLDGPRGVRPDDHGARACGVTRDGHVRALDGHALRACSTATESARARSPPPFARAMVIRSTGGADHAPGGGECGPSGDDPALALRLDRRARALERHKMRAYDVPRGSRASMTARFVTAMTRECAIWAAENGVGSRGAAPALSSGREPVVRVRVVHPER
jgi:hypothetical protein